MNARDDMLFAATLLAALSGLLLTVPAVKAQEASRDDRLMHAPATVTRADVLAELARARTDGSIRAFAIDYDFVATQRSRLTRDEVRRQLQAARASGELAEIHAEAHRWPAPQPSILQTAGAPTRR